MAQRSYKTLVSGGYVTEYKGRHIKVERQNGKWVAETVKYEAPFYRRDDIFNRCCDHAKTREEAVNGVAYLIDEGF